MLLSAASINNASRNFHEFGVLRLIRNAREARGMTRQTISYLFGVSLIATVALAAPNADASWTLTTLHSFTGGSDGAVPWAGVISDSAGVLYGTTQRGGGANSGTVYKLIPPRQIGRA